MKTPWHRPGKKNQHRQECLWHSGMEQMTYESLAVVESKAAPGVTFSVARMSFGRRLELMRRVRELARRAEFLEAGQEPGDRMDAALLQAEIDRLYLAWGLRSVAGLAVDGVEATPESLAEAGPEGLFREALEAVRTETGLNEAERKNS
jgi:hypothetical protein